MKTKPVWMRLIEALTLIFAIIALLSPFAAILLPALLQPLIAREQSVLSATSAWVQPLEVSILDSETDGTLTGSVSAAYIVIENRGAGTDRLIGVSTDAATKVEIYQAQIDEAGVVRIRLQPEGIDIPPNSTLTLEPLSNHIIILTGLESAQEFTLQLTFASGVAIDVSANVVAFPRES